MAQGLHQEAEGFGFLEAPRWHAGYLWLVDYFSRCVLRWRPGSEPQVMATVEGVPGGLGFLPDGTPLVVSQRDLQVLAIGRDGAVRVYADLAPYARGAANELLVDPMGRAYVGHHGFDFFGGAPLRPSSLLRIDTGGKVDVVAEGLIFPNGMALTSDGGTLVVAESFAHRLTSFTVDRSGALSAPRDWALLGEHTPDGVCLDADGAVWTGSPLTGQFLRVAAQRGVIDAIPTTNARWAVACVCGGAQRRTLFCVTAETTLEDMPRGLGRAFIESVELAVGGAGFP
jgi:sugar lactone lactonase YvrE